MNMSHCRQVVIVWTCPTFRTGQRFQDDRASPHHRSLSRAFALLVALTAALGCGGGNPAEQDAGFTTMGMPGVPSPTRVGANLVFADVAVDGKTGGRLGVDTGAPIMLVDATKYPGLTFPNQTEVTADITVGDLTIDAVSIVPMSFGGGMDPLNFAGLLGGNVMRQFMVRFDYAHPDHAFRLGMPPMEMATDGVETPGNSIDFALEGGGLGRVGDGGVVSFPATRIPIQVEIDGVAHPFVLDSGASETTVRASLFTTVTADGRAQLTGLPIMTVMGSSTASAARVSTLTAAGATVNDAVIMTIGDPLIDGLAMEVHHPVDGLLGGNFLRNFLVTIDYPGGVLHLQRYATPPIADEFQRVGVELGIANGAHRYGIARVYPGSDAATQQLSVRDEVVSVDGVALDDLDPLAADDALNGTVGTTKTIGLGNAQVAGLSNTTVTVRVDDLIPPPAP
jgi:hypothetical protein